MKIMHYPILFVLLFLIIENSVYAIIGTSENYTITIENARGIDFNIDKEENNYLFYLAIIFSLLILLLLIFRLKKIKNEKRG